MKIKMESGSPPPTGRVDGIQYQTINGTVIGRIWKGVQQRPSVIWRRMNQKAIEEDIAYEDLPEINRDAWNTAAAEDWWLSQCDIDWWLMPFTTPTDAGKQAHRATNMQRFLSGQEGVDMPQDVTTEPDSDALVTVPASGFLLNWQNRSSPPSGDFVASVYVAPANHASGSIQADADGTPQGVRTSRDYTYAFTAPIAYDTAFDASAIGTIYPGLKALPWILLRVTIAQSGNAPFIALHCSRSTAGL